MLVPGGTLAFAFQERVGHDVGELRPVALKDLLQRQLPSFHGFRGDDEIMRALSRGRTGGVPR